MKGPVSENQRGSKTSGYCKSKTTSDVQTSISVTLISAPASTAGYPVPGAGARSSNNNKEEERCASSVTGVGVRCGTVLYCTVLYCTVLLPQ